ncbi:LolA-like protein [Salinactinospora qingdaonensis]|uniref:hypothetical protein n=1 Tax=Salinactinospora qingdaonensis TaxID=702744 RepID=UPI0031E55A9A
MSTGCALDLSHLRPGGSDPSPSPSPSPTSFAAQPLLDSSLSQLAELSAVHLQGQFAGPDGAPNETDLTVTDSGAVSGTMRIAETDVSVVQADSQLYLSAADNFWLTQPLYNPDANTYVDHWVRVRTELLGFDPQAALTPAKLAESLKNMPAQGDATRERLSGTRAYRVELSDATVWLAEEEPHRLLRVEAEALASTGEGGDTAGASVRAAVNVEEPATEDVQQLYDDMATTAKDEFGSARDARIEIQSEGADELYCETGGQCTLTASVTDISSWESSGSVLVRMDATFTNDSLGEKSCHVTESLEAGGSVDLACAIDYALEPSTDPTTYEIQARPKLSTRALGGNAKDELVASIEKQREATLSGEEPSASSSPSVG